MRLLLAALLAVLCAGCSSELDFDSGIPDADEFRKAWNSGKHESLQIPKDGWSKEGEQHKAFISYDNLIITYEEATGRASLFEGSTARPHEFGLAYALLVELYIPDTANNEQNDVISKAFNGGTTRNGFAFHCMMLCYVMPVAATNSPAPVDQPGAHPTEADIRVLMQQVQEAARAAAPVADAASTVTSATRDVTRFEKPPVDASAIAARESAYRNEQAARAAQARELANEEADRIAEQRRLADERIQAAQQREQRELAKAREEADALKRMQDEHGAAIDAGTR